MTAKSSKELPFVVRSNDFLKMSLTLADGEFRVQRVLYLCLSRSDDIDFFLCVLFRIVLVYIYI